MTRERQRANYKNIFFAFIAAALIFSGGLFMGTQLTGFQIKKIGDYQEDLKTSLAGLELKYTLLEKNICGKHIFSSYGKELDDLGEKLSSIEARYNKDDIYILELKEPYFLLEIRHYLLLKEAKEKCGSDFNIILYFYSNNPKECKECSNQGYVLSYLQNKVGYDKVKIYSFDIRSESPSVQTLMEINKVEKAPSIVINGVTYNKELSLEEIQAKIEIELDEENQENGEIEEKA